MWDGGYGGWGGWVMLILTLIFVVAVIVGVIFLARGLGAGGQSPASGLGSGESPRDILKRRYAAGEIEREEYQQKLKDLGS